MDKFKFKIKELRLSRNLSQQQLANDLKVSKQAVSKWEKGRSLPDIASIEMIAAYFGVSTDYLLNDGIEVATPCNASDNDVAVVTDPPYHADVDKSSRKGFFSKLTKKEKWILLSAVCFLLVLVIVLSVCLGISEDRRRKASFIPSTVSLYGIEVTYMTHEAYNSYIRVDVFIQNTSEKETWLWFDTKFTIDRKDCWMSFESDKIWLYHGTGQKCSIKIYPPEAKLLKGSVTLYYIGHPVARCKFKSLI